MNAAPHAAPRCEIWKVCICPTSLGAFSLTAMDWSLLSDPSKSTKSSYLLTPLADVLPFPPCFPPSQRLSQTRGVSARCAWRGGALRRPGWEDFPGHRGDKRQIAVFSNSREDNVSLSQTLVNCVIFRCVRSNIGTIWTGRHLTVRVTRAATGRR